MPNTFIYIPEIRYDILQINRPCYLQGYCKVDPVNNKDDLLPKLFVREISDLLPNITFKDVIEESSVDRPARASYIAPSIRQCHAGSIR